MTLESQKPARLHKIVFLLINAVNWLGLFLRLMRRWHSMPSNLHFWGIYLAIVFPLLWYVMLREKSGLVSLVGITLAFLGVSFALSLSL